MRPLSHSTSFKLFATGATLGPLVDSLHNQCLLQYKVLPVSIPNLLSDDASSYWFCSSWTIPPLLGIAYVVLGGLLPRFFERGLKNLGFIHDGTGLSSSSSSSSMLLPLPLSQRAWIAVASTAFIIRLSELLETHSLAPGNSVLETMTGSSPAATHVLVLLLVALVQWATLDATWAALVAASVVSIGGPLSELPFVAQGLWEYIPEAGDYLPLAQIPALPGQVEPLTVALLGDNYRELALSSITGPCYFAVTMDAIALGRWFDEMQESKDKTRDTKMG